MFPRKIPVTHSAALIHRNSLVNRYSIFTLVVTKGFLRHPHLQCRPSQLIHLLQLNNHSQLSFAPQLLSCLFLVSYSFTLFRPFPIWHFRGLIDVIFSFLDFRRVVDLEYFLLGVTPASELSESLNSDAGVIPKRKYSRSYFYPWLRSLVPCLTPHMFRSSTSLLHITWLPLDLLRVPDSFNFTVLVALLPYSFLSLISL
jgi:hypothetical protein